MGIGLDADHPKRPDGEFAGGDPAAITATGLGPVWWGRTFVWGPVQHLYFSYRRGPADRSGIQGTCASQTGRGYVASPDKVALAPSRIRCQLTATY